MANLLQFLVPIMCSGTSHMLFLLEESFLLSSSLFSSPPPSLPPAFSGYSSFISQLKCYLGKPLEFLLVQSPAFHSTASRAHIKAVTVLYCNCLFNFRSIPSDSKLFYTKFRSAPIIIPNTQNNAKPAVDIQ